MQKFTNLFNKIDSFAQTKQRINDVPTPDVNDNCFSRPPVSKRRSISATIEKTINTFFFYMKLRGYSLRFIFFRCSLIAIFVFSGSFFVFFFFNTDYLFEPINAKESSGSVFSSQRPNKSAFISQKINSGSPAVEETIFSFLDEWKNSWEKSAGKNGVSDRYLSCYSDHFKTNGLDKTGWQQKKAYSNNLKEWISVDFSEIKLVETGNSSIYEVRFVQKYQSSNFSDVSRKVLVISREGAGWKILSEDTLDS